MEIVLLKDVASLGREGAVVRVKNGFARNYLLPRGVAAPATASQLKIVRAAAVQQQHKAQRLQQDAETLKQSLERHTVTLKLTLGEEGKSFGSITVHDLIEALAREGMVIEKHAVQLEQPIKALGTYEIPIHLHPQVTAMVKLHVIKA